MKKKLLFFGGCFGRSSILTGTTVLLLAGRRRRRRRRSATLQLLLLLFELGRSGRSSRSRRRTGSHGRYTAAHSCPVYLGAIPVIRRIIARRRGGRIRCVCRGDSGQRAGGAHTSGRTGACAPESRSYVDACVVVYRLGRIGQTCCCYRG